MPLIHLAGLKAIAELLHNEMSMLLHIKGIKKQIRRLH